MVGERNSSCITFKFCCETAICSFNINKQIRGAALTGPSSAAKLGKTINIDGRLRVYNLQKVNVLFECLSIDFGLKLNSCKMSFLDASFSVKCFIKCCINGLSLVGYKPNLSLYEYLLSSLDQSHATSPFLI